jgi:putative membrane protein
MPVAAAIVAGTIGGLVASWAMTRFHVALYGGGVTGVEEPQSHRPVDGGLNDPATKLADEIAIAVTDVPLTYDEKRVAGPLVHYAFGAGMGATYGLLSRTWPEVQRGSGVPFGIGVWAVADEIALPLLGLAHGPRAYPFAIHAEMLAAHVVFGYTTHVATRQALRLLDGSRAG